MISYPTHIRPSPLVTCSAAATKLCHNPLILPRVRAGFSTRIDFSCKLSHRHENSNFPKKIITSAQKRIWPVKNKKSEVEGVAAETGEDEEEGLREEEEEEEKESGDLVVEGCLISENEKKKIYESVEGLSEEGKKRIFKILMGLSEEEERKLSETVEEWIGKEYGKIGEFVEGLSEDGKWKIRSVLKDLSEEDKRKINELMERLDDEYKKNIIELVEGLSNEGLKRVIKYVVKHYKVMIDLNKEDRTVIEKFACMVNDEMKEIIEFMFCFYEFVVGEGETVKMSQFRDFFVGLGEGGKKNIVKFLEVLGLDEDKKRNFKNYIESLSGELNKKKIADLVNGFKETDYKKLIKKYSASFGIYYLSCVVACASMKMCPPFTAAFKHNNFHYLLSIAFNTSGLLLITACQGYKDIISNRKNATMIYFLLGGFNAASGLFLADLHFANSNGIIMLASLISTMAMSVIAILSSVFEVVAKDGDLNCFEPSKCSVFMAMNILSSFLQIFNGGPITTAIDAGLSALIFSVFTMNDMGKFLKFSEKDEDYTTASAHISWDFSGLFVTSIKLLVMLSGLFIRIA